MPCDAELHVEGERRKAVEKRSRGAYPCIRDLRSGLGSIECTLAGASVAVTIGLTADVNPWRHGWRRRSVTGVDQNGTVSIDEPTDQAIRGTAALRSLVEAVIAANPHDEADWIEWKGPLDLATKEGCFHVARAVLGLANREPERAQLVAEGLGYVVVGAEPGSLHGLTTVDPAQLDQVVEQYLGGADGPAWTPAYIPIGQTTVLVVTVEVPRPGDPIHTLRREFGKYREAAVFVRKHGRTDLAGAADMDALQRRLLASGGRRQANLAVSVVGDVPLSWFDSSTVQKEIEAWADAQHDRLVEPAREVERQREAAKAKRREASGFGILGGVMFSPALS